MSVITPPQPLRDKLGESATEAFVEVVREVDLSARQEAILIAEERFERRLTEETGKTNERITEEISKVNERLTLEIGRVNERLVRMEKELENKADKADIKELEVAIKTLELRLTVKLGALLATSVAVVAVLVKLM